MPLFLSFPAAAVVVGAELAADAEIAAVVDADVLIAEVGAVLAKDYPVFVCFDVVFPALMPEKSHAFFSTLHAAQASSDSGA